MELIAIFYVVTQALAYNVIIPLYAIINFLS